ncbi:hypothetical protein [Niveispirillum cyanobacteriorum]|uniref:Uncharacterized protein n=1 Tax=Niveispirillum cyanobacteriorum TaxID=1612173 RepID=A0A2K9NC54_9PROT|nr:hypothetical protein [Niveispirillum cyanobacteriorum]AUN30126.1 hypothetical protein C0V82_07690 [Niveispirillum cyanobacteriorum]GGE57700.1 hypothetical protein GCM10011317_14530 [Niveispirillum cyanobacteriorum]
MGAALPPRQRLTRTVVVGLVSILALLSIMLMADLVIALGAEACGHPDANSNCYPWSPHAEGPIEGAWNYHSKSLYLFAGGVHLTFVVTAMLTMIRWRNLRGILVAVCLLGTHGVAHAWADQAIGSRTDIIELSDLPKLL